VAKAGKKDANRDKELAAAFAAGEQKGKQEQKDADQKAAAAKDAKKNVNDEAANKKKKEKEAKEAKEKKEKKEKKKKLLTEVENDLKALEDDKW
jgi:hypothetical protein